MKTASRSSCGLQDDHAQRWDRDFDVFTGQRYAEAIADLWLRRKVGRDDDKASIVPPAQPGEYGVFGVVALLPWFSRAFRVIY